MAKNNESETLATPERDEIMAYLMAFVLESYQAVENEDAEALVRLLNTKIDDILAFRDGKSFPMTNSVVVRSKNNGWRLV